MRISLLLLIVSSVAAGCGATAVGGALAARCSTGDDCAPGLVCLENRCREPCAVDADCEIEAEICRDGGCFAGDAACQGNDGAACQLPGGEDGFCANGGCRDCQAPTHCDDQDSCTTDGCTESFTCEHIAVDGSCCNANGQCPADAVCVIEITDEPALELRCEPPVGDGGIGTDCSANAECQNGLCLEGQCAVPCRDDDDCDAGTVCHHRPVELPNGDVEMLAVCVPLAPCDSNADCSAGEICVVDRSRVTAALNCGLPVGGGGIGDDCVVDADCQSNLCIAGTCSAPCEDSADCLLADYMCANTEVSTSPPMTMPICVPRPPGACGRDADCEGLGDRCVASKDSTSVTFSCGVPNPDGGETGDPCGSDDAACAQNLCVDGRCAGPCVGDADCSIAPTYQCEVTTIDLGGGNTDSASICVPPIPCAKAAACSGGDVCYVQREQDSIDTICHSGNPGGQDTGDQCADDAECAANLCFPDRFQSICSVPCVDATEDCPTDYVCSSSAVQTLSGGSELVDICVAADPDPCTAQSDCIGNTTCALVVNSAGTGLELLCIPQSGGAGNGLPCGDNAECASLICLDGYCAAPCDSVADCVGSQLCNLNSITRGSLSGDFSVCEMLPDVQCNSSRDCIVATRVCGDLRSEGGETVPYCVYPNTTSPSLARGATCSTNSECLENICLDGVSSECTVVCEDSDLDCSAGQVCSSYFAGPTRLGFCANLCMDNDDCSSRTPGNICTINPNPIRNSLDAVCQIQYGAGDLGDTCTTNAECMTGLCMRTFIYTATDCTTDGDCTGTESCQCPIDQPGCSTGKRCAQRTNACTFLCDDTPDCSAGVAGNKLTVCSSNVFLALPDGNGSQQFSACIGE